ncbi:hypothetical protein [Streptomyces sp. NPDC002328]|uniref:hypothetical protein n=1 Tax=Streptomyces sp. NPDC002328 TaxID=3364642 RepID=UPI00367DDF23
MGRPSRARWGERPHVMVTAVIVVHRQCSPRVGRWDLLVVSRDTTEEAAEQLTAATAVDHT